MTPGCHFWNSSLAALAIVIIVTAFFVAGCVENKTYLSESEKTKAVAIALNDSIAMGKVQQVASKFTWQNGMIYNSTNPEFYRIGNITMDNVREIAPGVDRIRYLPSVELIMGNRSQGDINIYIYVDLESERPVYVGYLNRSGPNAGQYYYTNTDEGVIEHVEYSSHTRVYRNVTIVDTGYVKYHGLTDKDKSVLFDIATKNETVTAFLNDAAGRGEKPVPNFWFSTSEDRIDGHSYVSSYPELSLHLIKPDGSSGRKYLVITVDGNKDVVKAAREGEVFMPPPPHLAAERLC